MELDVEIYNKTFDSTILLGVSRERRLSHWYGFAKLVSFVLAAMDIVIKLFVIWKFKSRLDLLGVTDRD